MQNKDRSITKHTKLEIIIIAFLISVVGYILYLLILSTVDTNRNYNSLIFLFNWVGIFVGVYVVSTWYKLTGTILSPYTIFILFFILFNYGQCIMWAFGMHIPSEIGQLSMYNKFGIVSDIDIIKAQVLTLVSVLMFHFGAIFCYKPRNGVKLNEKSTYLDLNENGDSKTLKAIYYSCLIVGIVVIPITLYLAYDDFRIARIYGYNALYYSNFARTSATIPILLSKMFFPCLIGLLIGSKYNKKVRKNVYIIFVIYMIVNLLCGDRGSWIYRLFILIWLNNVCYKPVNFKVIAKYLIFGITGLYITNVIVSVRNIGLSNVNVDGILENISFEKSPFASAIFEMGSSMQPTIMLQKYGWNIWPFANSYLLAVLGMITNKLIYALDIPFTLLSLWFSQIYLDISYGAGFSIIAEALLNYGPILAPIFMILQGFIITSMIYIDKDINYKKRPLRYFFAAATLDCFVNITRNELHSTLKNWFYGVIVLYLFILIIRKLLFKENFINLKKTSRLL